MTCENPSTGKETLKMPMAGPKKSQHQRAHGRALLQVIHGRIDPPFQETFVLRRFPRPPSTKL